MKSLPKVTQLTDGKAGAQSQDPTLTDIFTKMH